MSSARREDSAPEVVSPGAQEVISKETSNSKAVAKVIMRKLF
jgi:hypothetical protein